MLRVFFDVFLNCVEFFMGFIAKLCKKNQTQECRKGTAANTEVDDCPHYGQPHNRELVIGR